MKHEEEMQEIMEKHAKETQDMGMKKHITQHLYMTLILNHLVNAAVW